MIIIGEKINGSIPIVAEAIAKRDSEFIKERAKLQAESGATYIDCCASVPEAEEVETLKWMIDCIQEVTDLPISIDIARGRLFWHRLISFVRNLEFLILYQERDIRLIRFSRSWLSREMRDGR
mgnify:CR=1 FL=1